MTPNHENWAAALLIENQHGDRAPLFVAERVGALVMAGDEVGVAKFKAIAACLHQLRARLDSQGS